MKKLNTRTMIRLVVIAFVVATLVFSAKNIFNYYQRSGSVDPTLVEFYRPNLNINLVRQAAEYLQNK